MRKNAYHGGEFFKAIGEDFQNLGRSRKVISADVLDAWFDPSPRAIRKIKKHLAFALRTSPPTHCDGLVEVIAKYRGIPASHIVTAGGSSDLMFIALPQLVKAGQKVLILDPMYGEYAHIFSKVLDVELYRHELQSENYFQANIDALIKDIHEQQPSLIVLVNPNSPTGQLIEKTDMLRVLEAVPQDANIVIDETYIEYVGSEQSLEKEVERFANLVIIKSMSKTYALSGARVGYLVAQPEIVDRISLVTPPWSVSLIGQIAAIEALKDDRYYRRQYQKTHRLRETMRAAFSQVAGVEAFPSIGNFFLLHLKDARLSAKNIVAKLKTEGIYLRDCSSMGVQMQDRFIRVAIKDARTNRRVIHALKKFL